MPKIVVVEKGGELREINLKSYSEEELYKKAGFKSSDGFEFQTNWEVDLKKNGEKKTVCLYAKTKGRAGQENKYDFPPPVDKKLYYGACVLVNTVDGKVAGDISVEEWEKMYEHLFGGFEDIGSEDSSDSSDANDKDNDLPKTKHGYAKDGFIVDSSEEDKEENEKSSKKQKKPAKKSSKKTAAKKGTVFEQIGDEQEEQETNGIMCEEELEEEPYL